ncbi:MAG TPA: hypothetical protein VGR89_16570 [Puia sp.]|nr:hypothetical protein [Puia sp.]
MKQSLHSFYWKCLCLLAITLCCFFPSFAQEEERNTTEFGFTTGPIVALTDLGGHAGRGTTFIKDYNFNTTKMMFGAYFAAFPAQWLGFRLSANYGNVEAFDADIKAKGGDEVTRLNRNLDFRSVILEGTAMAEVYPTVFLEDDPEDVQGRLRPYGLIGLGVFHFNPQGSLSNGRGITTWYDLRPLHTEGEGWVPGVKEYSLTQLNIPMGAGLKYYLSEDVNLSVELIYRKLFTDYLDDVSGEYIDPSLFTQHLSPSQAAIAIAISNKAASGYNTPGYKPGDKRGTPSNNDAYFTFGIKLGIRLTGGQRERWYNSTHCPLLRF